MNINKVIIGGNLTRDPELTYMQSGTALVKCVLANNQKFKDKEDTAFVEFEVWGDQAERVQKYFTKGKPIVLEGEWRQSSWEADGKTRRKDFLKVSKFHFVGSKES